MRSDKLIGTAIANALMHKSKKRRKEKKKSKEQMIKMFGETRYYLALLLGEWALWTCNPTIYGKRAVCQQPSNVIYLADYKVAHAK